MKLNIEKWTNARQRICSRKDLSDQTGISYEIVRKIETSKREISPNDPQYLAMCDCLHFEPLDYLARDTKVITIFSNKGGSTKTTTSVNLAYSLAVDYNYKVLVIDTDLQQNLTQNFGVVPNDFQNFYEAFIKGDDIRKYITKTPYENIDIVMGHDDLSDLERIIFTFRYAESRMSEMLSKVVSNGEYDYIIIDCSPHLNMLNTSSLFASDGLIVPFNPGAFGKNGIKATLKFYQETEKREESRIKLMGIVVNRYSKVKVVHRDVLQLLAEELEEMAEIKDDVMFKTYIPEDTSIEKGQMMNEPIAVSFAKSKAVDAYKQFAAEVIERGRV